MPFYGKKKQYKSAKITAKMLKDALATVNAPKRNYYATAGKAVGVGVVGYAGSKYQHSRKKTSIHARATPEGTGGFRSRQVYTPRKMPRGYAKQITTLAKNYYAINSALKLTVGPGLQQAVCPLQIFNKTDVNGLSQKIASSQVNKLLLMSATSEVVMTNQDAGNCRVYVYDIIARRDLSTASNILTPLAAWQNSYTDEGGSNSNYQVVGTNPFSSDLFTQFFKVAKVTHVTLAQGQSHTHSVSFNVNKQIDGEYINYEGNGFKGLSHFVMVVAHGFPYNDSTTKTQVSTGNVSLDMCTKIQYKFTWMNDYDTTFSVSNNLLSSFTVGESIMDIGTGAVATDTQA